jgi:hypothetical protein
MIEDDMMTEHGAHKLAVRLREFWRIYPKVKFTVEKHGHPRRPSEYLWCVRSNLINGLPPHA